jgi:enamine deaminase RidA (YjgF/YER057c/UK114 family)
MAHLQFYNYEGVGVKNQQDYWYSQAVRIGDRIECAGQGALVVLILYKYMGLRNFMTGGWDPKSGEIPQEINAEIDQAFENVELNLKHAGGKGWDQVFRVNSYHVPMDNEALGAMVRNFKKWMPGHQPIWTCVGVPNLAQDNMHVEIEVVAHVP